MHLPETPRCQPRRLNDPRIVRKSYCLTFVVSTNLCIVIQELDIQPDNRKRSTCMIVDTSGLSTKCFFFWAHVFFPSNDCIGSDGGCLHNFYFDECRIDIQVWAMHTAYVGIIVLLKVALHFRSAFAIRGVPGTELLFI